MESIATQVAHWLTTVGVFSILGVVLKQHKIWVRLKDRVNTLWSDRCEKKNELYVPLENGR